MFPVSNINYYSYFITYLFIVDWIFNGPLDLPWSLFLDVNTDFGLFKYILRGMIIFFTNPIKSISFSCYVLYMY